MFPVAGTFQSPVEFALGQNRWSSGFLPAQPLVCIWNRKSLVKIICILSFVVENRNLFFVPCVSAVSISLDRCSALLSSGGNKADGSASLARKGSCWVVSETFLAGNCFRAATPRSSFCGNDRNWKRVYIRDSYELLLNDTGEEFSISSFNRSLHSGEDCTAQFLPAKAASVSRSLPDLWAPGWPSGLVIAECIIQQCVEVFISF